MVLRDRRRAEEVVVEHCTAHSGCVGASNVDKHPLDRLRRRQARWRGKERLEAVFVDKGLWDDVTAGAVAVVRRAAREAPQDAVLPDCSMLWERTERRDVVQHAPIALNFGTDASSAQAAGRVIELLGSGLGRRLWGVWGLTVPRRVAHEVMQAKRDSLRTVVAADNVGAPRKRALLPSSDRRRVSHHSGPGKILQVGVERGGRGCCRNDCTDTRRLEPCMNQKQ